MAIINNDIFNLITNEEIREDIKKNYPLTLSDKVLFVEMANTIDINEKLKYLKFLEKEGTHPALELALDKYKKAIDDLKKDSRSMYIIHRPIYNKRKECCDDIYYCCENKLSMVKTNIKKEWDFMYYDYVDIRVNKAEYLPDYDAILEEDEYGLNNNGDIIYAYEDGRPLFSCNEFSFNYKYPYSSEVKIQLPCMAEPIKGYIKYEGTIDPRSRFYYNNGNHDTDIDIHNGIFDFGNETTALVFNYIEPV